jgi:hypothetical protein
MPSGHEQSLHPPLLQDQSRDHPLGGDDVCPTPIVITERRGPAARARHRQIAPPPATAGSFNPTALQADCPGFRPAAVAQLLEVVLAPNGRLNFAD